MAGRHRGDRTASAVASALRSPRLRRMLAAYLVFNTAEWAIWIAMLVYGYSVDGVRGSSVIALVQVLPSIVLAAPVAASLGRLPRATALRLGYVAQCVAFAVLGGALVADLHPVVVALCAALSAVTITLTRPAHHALLPQISATTGDLTAGNAASGSLEALAIFLGPLLSGAAVGVAGPGGVLLVCAVGALGSAVLTAPLRSAAPLPREKTGVASGPGPMRAVLADPGARFLSLLVAAEFAMLGMSDILLVVLALDVLSMSDAGPGLLNSGIGIGGILGAGLTFLLVGRQRLAPALVAGAVVAGAGLALAGLSTLWFVALALVAVNGAGKVFYDVASRTFVQRLLPDRLLTAVFGVQESFMMAGLALGTLTAPLLVTTVGPRLAFVVAGAFLPAVALAAWRPLSRMDATTHVPADVLALLLEVPILSVLPPRIVERLARDAERVEAAPDAVVVAQGDLGSCFYVVESGALRVTIDGTELRDLGPGSWFGEIALLRGVPRTATVTAVEDTVLHAVDRESFRAAVLTVPTSVEVADRHARDHYAGLPGDSDGEPAA